MAATEADDAEAASGGFEAIVEVGTLADAMESVGVLVNECKLRTESEGLQVRAVDPANVGMVDMALDADAFESYQGGGGVLGIKLDRFEDILSLGDSDDLVHLTLDQETRKLHVEIDGLSYTLALIDPEAIRTEPDIPDLDLTATAELTGSQLDRGLTAADMVSDHIRLRATTAEPAFHIEAEGDTDDVSLTLEREDLQSFDPGTADSLFSLDYLKDMNKSQMRRQESVSVRVGKDFPTKLNWEFASGDGEVTYMLAPRVESN